MLFIFHADALGNDSGWVIRADDFVAHLILTADQRPTGRPTNRLLKNKKAELSQR